MDEERIQKILARAGYGSRRSCEELITSGRVRVNGNPVILGQKADSQNDKITVDGNVVHAEKALVYIAYNKPRFVLCDKTIGDDSRRTVFDMVEGGADLVVVGRLDFESEGLVVLTNDGDMVNRLTHPRYQHEKEYRVLLASHPDAKQLEVWRRGVVLEDGHRTSPANVTVESDAGKGTWVRVVLKEGHKRQIRETAKMTGLFVVKLIRTRISSLRLGILKSGESRKLTPEEISTLKDTTKPGRKIGFVRDMSRKPVRKEESIAGERSDTRKKSYGKKESTTGEPRKTYRRTGENESSVNNEQKRTYKKPFESESKTGQEPKKTYKRPVKRADSSTSEVRKTYKRPERGEGTKSSGIKKTYKKPVR